MKTKSVLLIANMVVVGAVFLLVSCGQTTAKPAPTLENTTWVLQSYGQPGNMKTVLTSADKLKDIRITATFDSERREVTGSSGVNTYGGHFGLRDNILTISGLMVTLLAGPQALIDQERDYLDLLEASKSYRLMTASCT